jgi:hypothetical protein
MTLQRHMLAALRQLAVAMLVLVGVSAPATAGNPATYCPDTDKLMWFIHASDIHVGTSGSTDTTNLQWLATTAMNVIAPSFIVVSGDLTDSTNGNIFGYPNGPYQAEWDAYKTILGNAGADASFYFDLPGNHDAYNDRYFAYYLANSVQGRATGKTQASWTRTGAWGKYHFLGASTPDNTGAAFSIFWPYGDNAGLDSSELTFIGNELATHADADLTLIFGHHPLVATGDDTDTYLFYGKDELVSQMDIRKAALYGYGHTHASSRKFFSQNMSTGVFYFNVSALGKDSPNQYTVTAIDCNGLASVTQNVGTWPVVLVTAPMDRNLGGIVNPYAYTVSNASANPIRALVLDPAAVSQVQYRVNGGTLQPMSAVTGNPRLWQGAWNASALPEGVYTIDVVATTGSGVRTNTVTTYLKSQAMPKIGVVAPLETGKYVTSGGGKSKTTVFSPTSTFKRGESVVIRATVKNATGAFVANATVQLAVSGPASVSLTSAPSTSAGIAEAKWVTTAPNKRGIGGTPIGGYAATVTNVSAAGHEWDGTTTSVNFLLQ